MVKTAPPAPLPMATVPVPGRLQYVAAAVAILLAVIATAFALPYRALQLPVAIGIVSACGSLIAFADFFTAALLLGQSYASRSKSLACLAAAYSFCLLIVIPHLLSFPGLFTQAPLLGSPGTTAWLWSIWHFGFPIFVASYALVRDDAAKVFDRSIALPIIVIVAALAAILMATVGLPALPTLVVGSTYTHLNSLGLGPVVALCNAAALVCVVVGRRARDTLALWITVAMVCSTLETCLGMLAADRYSLAWYLARTLGLMSNLVVLVALLFQSMRLFTRASLLNRHLEHLSLTDQLTQLPNRRAFDRSFDAEWQRAAHENLPISLLMIDIDLFKAFNDRLGHPAGDQCLGQVARTINSLARRPLDMAARLGGEEFVLLLPNTDAAGARQMAETVRAAINALRIHHPGAPRGHLTVSIGTATLQPFGQTVAPATLIERADQALYAAKRAGRNCVATAAPAPLPAHGSEAGLLTLTPQAASPSID